MGLDVSHDCWHGAYSAFHRWRTEIATHFGIPLDLMEGFYDSEGPGFRTAREILEADKQDPKPYCHYEKYFMATTLGNIMTTLPLKWSSFKSDPIHILLSHSDCDGFINYGAAGKIAKSLEKVIDNLPEQDDLGHIKNWKETTQRFINGLKLANSLKQKVTFH